MSQVRSETEGGSSCEHTNAATGRERLRTPPASVDVAAWLASLPPEDVAYVQGAAFQRLAMHAGVSEADLYAEWARRAADDPDCQVVRDG